MKNPLFDFAFFDFFCGKAFFVFLYRKKNAVIFFRSYSMDWLYILRTLCMWLSIAFILSGCGGSAQTSQSFIDTHGSVSMVPLAGRINGGRQPIVGSHVYVYATGITGSTAPTQIGSAVTGADGTFSIASWSVTPVNGDLIYLTAIGGDAGGGVNPNIALMSVAGVWGDAGFVSHVQVNELTTIAFISQFTNHMVQVPCASITGSTATGGICPRILGEGDWTAQVAQVVALVDVGTGQASVNLQTATNPSTAYATYQNLNLQASVLANCVNSAGGVAGDGSACGNLLGLASSQAVAGILTENGGTTIVGAQPTAIATSHDGQFAYVANFGDNTISTLRIANDGTLSAFGQPITVGLNPFYFSISKDGKIVYVSNSGDNTLSTMQVGSDGSLSVVGQPIMTGLHPGVIALTPDGHYAFVANAGDGTISSYSINHGNLSPLGQPLLVGVGPVSILVSSDGKFAYVSDPDARTLVSLGVSNGNLSIINSLSLNEGPFSMSIAPNGKFAVVANFNDASFSVFNVTQGALSLIGFPIADSSRLTDVAFTPNGQFFYVVDSGLHDTETFSMDQSGNVIQLGDAVPGSSPWSIALSQNGQFAFVTNLDDGTVSSFRISTGTPSDTWSAIANLQANPTNTAAALFALAPSPAVYGPMPSMAPTSLTLH